MTVTMVMFVISRFS